SLAVAPDRRVAGPEAAQRRLPVEGHDHHDPTRPRSRARAAPARSLRSCLAARYAPIVRPTQNTSQTVNRLAMRQYNGSPSAKAATIWPIQKAKPPPPDM